MEPYRSDSGQADLRITLAWSDARSGQRLPHLAVSRRGQQTPTEKFAFKYGLATLRTHARETADLMDKPVFDPFFFPPAAEDRLDTIRPVAEHGWKLLEMLTDGDRQPFLDLLNSLPLHAVVEWEARGANIPWNFVYLEDPSRGTVDPMKFFGAKFLVVQPVDRKIALELPDESRGINPLGPAAVRGYGLVDDDQLPAVRAGVERDVLRGRCTHLFSPLTAPGGGLPLGNGRPREADLDRYAAYLSGNWAAVHFATHANVPAGDPTRFKMRVTTEFWHTISELLDAMKSRGGVSAIDFLFFNCCHSDHSDGGDPSAAATLMAERGVSSAVAVLAGVQDGYAARFAHEFYDLVFRAGITVGRALIQARTALLGETGNPSALLYNLRGNVSATIAVHDTA